MDSIYPSPHEPKPLGSLPEGHGLYAADNSRLPTGRTYDASKEATAAVRPSRGGTTRPCSLIIVVEHVPGIWTAMRIRAKVFLLSDSVFCD